MYDQTATPLGPGLREIDKRLGKYIRARGQHFHEWFEHNTHVQYFSMIELINSVKRSDGPMGNVEGHYRDAKMMLGWDIEAAGESAEAILRGAVHGQIGDLVKMLKKFNGLVGRLEKRAKRSP